MNTLKQFVRLLIKIKHVLLTQHVNDLALYIDLEESVAKAEGIFLQIKDSPSVGQEVRRILGIDSNIAKPEDVVQTKRSSS
jgi:hypothetical protein